MSVGSNIRYLRKKRRMTQVCLSARVGVAQETISAYESDRAYPSAVSLMAIAKELHASIDCLLGVCDTSKNDALCAIIYAPSPKEPPGF